MKFSVIYSFRNEEQILLELIQRTEGAISRIGDCTSYEIIFVNDDSTDGSLALLSGVAERNKSIKILNMSRNFGVSECVMAGFAHSSGDYVFYLDADLQDPPELFPSMYDKAKLEKADVVFTVRTKRAGEGFTRRLVTRLGYWILKKFSGIPVVSESGDFKLLSRRVVQEVLRLTEKKPFVRGLIVFVGFKQVPIYYERDARAEGKSHYPIFGSRVIKNFLDSALISFSDAPLKLILVLGFLTIIFSVLFMVWIMIQKLIGWAIPGWSAIMASIFFFAGIQMFTLGIFGLYINAIFLEVKSRPNYIIKDKINF